VGIDVDLVVSNIAPCARGKPGPDYMRIRFNNLLALGATS